MARYELTGMIDPALMNLREAAFGDFSEELDFHTAQNMVIAAQEAFMTIPAEIRSRFNNDPGQLMTWLNDKNNIDEAIRLGLAHITKEAPNDKHPENHPGPHRPPANTPEPETRTHPRTPGAPPPKQPAPSGGVND